MKDKVIELVDSLIYSRNEIKSVIKALKREGGEDPLLDNLVRAELELNILIEEFSE